MKKFLAASLAMALCFGTAACGGNEVVEEKQEAQETVKEEFSGEESKTYAAFDVLENGIYMDVISYDEETEGTELVFAVDAENNRAYMEGISEGEEVVFIMNEDGVYMMIPAEKAYMNFDINLFEDGGMPIPDTEEFPEVTYTTGTEEIMGTEYEYEEFVSDTGVDRYYFEEDALKYVKSVNEEGESLMEIVELRGSVDASLFDIPADYTEISLASLFGSSEE